MVEAGAAMITVHGRTRTRLFKSRRLRSSEGPRGGAVADAHPGGGNGDVVSLLDYVRDADRTGCDAVMIGRGKRGTLAVSRHLAWLRARASSWAPTVEERSEVFSRHCALMRGRTEEKRPDSRDSQVCRLVHRRVCRAGGPCATRSKAPRDPRCADCGDGRLLTLEPGQRSASAAGGAVAPDESAAAAVAGDAEPKAACA